jgi:hypothetical protein
VMPRFRLSANCGAEIVLRAFLRQPLIPVGHHEDVAAGLDCLSEIAHFINRLGRVSWMDMKTMSRTNYLSYSIEQKLRIKLFSRTAEVRIPEDIGCIEIERPWLGSGAATEKLIVRSSTATLLEENRDRQSGDLKIGPHRELKIMSVPENMRSGSSVRCPGVRFYAVARRMLTETRDRLKPLLRRPRRHTSFRTRECPGFKLPRKAPHET